MILAMPNERKLLLYGLMDRHQGKKIFATSVTGGHVPRDVFIYASKSTTLIQQPQYETLLYYVFDNLS